MMELKFNPNAVNNGKQEFSLGSSSNKNSVTNKKGVTDFQKAFNNSKNKSVENLAQGAKDKQTTSGSVQESAGITVVDKPVVQEKDWATELGKEEQEKIKKAVDLLLTFFENHFPKKKEEIEEIEETPEEDAKVLSVLEKVAKDEGVAEQLAQVFSKELEITPEKAQEMIANLKKILANSPELSTVKEQLAVAIAQAVAPEKVVPTANVPVAPESSTVANVQTTNRENITMSTVTPVEQNLITNAPNPNGITPKIDGQNTVMLASNTEAKNADVKSAETKNVEQTINKLVEKSVVEDAISLVQAPKVEKLSSAQMPALQSHANFIVGKLNSDSMAKNNPKNVDKVDIALSVVPPSQPTVSMMSLQTKLGQQFADLQNSHKNNLEQSIKPLQDLNQVKSTYADLLFPNNKNAELENVEVNLLEDRAAISRQIVDNIKVMQKNNNTEMVIKLKPEHMGEMILRISTNAAGTISASFQTNNPEARLALESTMLALKQELAANGLKVQDVDLFGGISDFLSGQSQANKDQKSNHSSKSFVEQEEKIENIVDKLGEQELSDDGNVDYRI